MSNDIEFLQALCERMRQVGLVQSKADFSTRLLGKGTSYLTSMSARDRKVSEEVIAFLRQQLEADIAVGENTLATLQTDLNGEERSQKHRYQFLGEITENQKIQHSDYQNGDANDDEKRHREKRKEILLKFLAIFRLSLRAFPK